MQALPFEVRGMKSNLPILALLVACGGTSSPATGPTHSQVEGAEGAETSAVSPDAPRAPAGSNSASIGTPADMALVAEINLLRANPRAYAEKLRAARRFYNGNRIEVPGKITVLTLEGIAAVDEAISVLEKTAPRPVLTNQRGLHTAAVLHAEDIGPRGSLDHSGRDGSSPFDRIQRYGRVAGLSGENLDFGSNDPEEVVIHLLIDDGVSNRGHRKNLLEPAFRHVGAACRPHRAYAWVCPMEFAEGYVSK